MAKRNYKGITVEIGGDTSGLEKALSGVNKEIKNTQDQLRDVERLLKLDPGNTELLEQKQRLLGKAISETKGKLDTLKTAEKQAQEQFKQGKISQEQYDALKREIAETEKNLEKLENRAKSSSGALSKIGAATEDMSKKFTAAGKAAAPFSAAAAGALTGLTAMAGKAALAADDINTLAKQTGLTTEQIQKFQYATDLIDVPLETLTGSMAKLTKNMATAQKGTGDAAEAFETLGIKITNSDGSLRNNQEVFNETIQALGKMRNETQRDALAMQIFGKSAQDLNPLILGGAEALEELGEQAEAAGLILSQDALDAANAFNDEMDTLKATTKATMAVVGSELAETLLPVLKVVSEALQRAMDVIRGIDGRVLTLIITILALVAGLAPLLMIVGQVAAGVSALSGLFATLSGTVIPALSAAMSFLSGTVIPAIGSALAFLAANPIVLVIAAIVALIAAIALFGDQIQAVLAKVNDFMQNIFTKDWTEQFGILGNVLNGFFVYVKGIWDAVMLILNGVIDFIRGIFTGDWKRAWTGITEIFGGIFKGIETIAKAPLNGIIALLNGAIDGINQMISALNKLSIDIPDWVPLIGGKTLGFNIKEISSIPYLWKGGVMSSGTAVVGEQGPELLSLLSGGRAQVTPLTGAHKAQAMRNVQQPIYQDNRQYTFKVEDIETYRLIEQSMRQEQMRYRMGYVRG